MKTPDTDKMLAKTLNLKLARIIKDNGRRTNNSDSGGGDDWWLSPKKKLECPGCGGINFTISRGTMVEGDRYLPSYRHTTTLYVKHISVYA